MQPASHHVLIIEDEAPIRRFLKASLTNAGYRISEAVTGAEEVRLAVSLPPDLVILDLGLPDLDGQEVLRRLREWYTSPVIVLSAHNRNLRKFGIRSRSRRLRHQALRCRRTTGPDAHRHATHGAGRPR